MLATHEAVPSSPNSWFKGEGVAGVSRIFEAITLDGTPERMGADLGEKGSLHTPQATQTLEACSRIWLKGLLMVSHGRIIVQMNN